MADRYCHRMGKSLLVRLVLAKDRHMPAPVRLARNGAVVIWACLRAVAIAAR